MQLVENDPLRTPSSSAESRVLDEGSEASKVKDPKRLASRFHPKQMAGCPQPSVFLSIDLLMDIVCTPFCPKAIVYGTPLCISSLNNQRARAEPLELFLYTKAKNREFAVAFASYSNVKGKTWFHMFVVLSKNEKILSYYASHIVSN
ncbi:hypothetical protein KIN20_014078 [Parelaphostrongylus tenuis]|uniref:Uncharacterized protein n=1 Tax=Parelaphostrongylus tenuis TaxID=148309 RepID=A0AAD5MZ03_PARTN|nr:hypothetical protein KIN20_014078 [Parelaphostrongylus tenuis]